MSLQHLLRRIKQSLRFGNAVTKRTLALFDLARMALATLLTVFGIDHVRSP